MNTLKTTQCPSSQVPAVQAPREYPLEPGVRLRARVQAAVPVLQAAELPLGDLLHAAEGLPRRLHGNVRELDGVSSPTPHYPHRIYTKSTPNLLVVPLMLNKVA